MSDIANDSFTITRHYPQGRAQVWASWAEIARKSRWLGEIEHMDFTPGGRERKVMHDAMGEHVNETCYFEIAPQERIVLAYSMALNGRVHTVSLVTVIFADEGNGTRLGYTEQICVIPPSDGVVGRKQGWGILLDRLGGALQDERQGTGQTSRAGRKNS